MWQRRLSRTDYLPEAQAWTGTLPEAGPIPPAPVVPAAVPEAMQRLPSPATQMQAPPWLMQQFTAVPHPTARHQVPLQSIQMPVSAWQEGPSASQASSAPAVLQQHKPAEEAIDGVLRAALSHFSATWETLGSSGKRAARTLAADMVARGDLAGCAMPLHATILKALRQHREWPSFIEPERFTHPENFNPHPLAGETVFGAITINAAHRDEWGTFKYYLEQQPEQGGSSAQHACNGMVGGPVVSLGDFAEYEAREYWPPITPERFQDAVEQITLDMRKQGTCIETIRAVLQKKLGIATRLYQHAPAVITDGALSQQQARLLDAIETDRLLLQCVIPEGDDATVHAAAFRKDDKGWILLDSKDGKQWEGMTPSLYLETQGAIGFNAIWPQRGLVSSEAVEMPVDVAMAQQAIDEIWLADRLRLEAGQLHTVIPEWDGEAGAVRLWRELPRGAALQGTHVKPLEISSDSALVEQLAGEEGRRLYAMLMQHQLQRQAVAPEDTDMTVPPASWSAAVQSKAPERAHPLQREWRTRKACGANRPEPPGNLQSGMEMWRAELKKASTMAPGDARDLFLAEVRRKWLDIVTAGDLTPWDTWPIRAVSFEESKKRWRATSKGKVILRMETGDDQLRKLAYWKRTVVVAEQARDAPKGDPLKYTLWRPPVVINGILLDARSAQWTISYRMHGERVTRYAGFDWKAVDLSRKMEEAWCQALDILAEMKAESVRLLEGDTPMQEDSNDEMQVDSTDATALALHQPSSA